MAKTIAEFSKDVKAYLAKNKVKAARKTLDKAAKAGIKQHSLQELDLTVRLAEGDDGGSAKTLRALAADPARKLGAALKAGDAHLRLSPNDIEFRDALWEVALGRSEFDLATRHLSALVGNKKFDGAKRAQTLLARKDAVGATGIFLLASLGGVKTDRVKLADRLLKDETASPFMEGVVLAIQKKGNDDGAVNYALAQIAKKRGDREEFVEYAGRAFDEVPEELWTWTESNATSTDLLEIAARKQSLTHLLKAAKSAPPEAIVEVAQKSKTDGATGGALRSMALLLQGKTPNACRVIEKTLADSPELLTPFAELLAGKRGEWAGAPVLTAAVLCAGDDSQAGRAADALLQEPLEARDDAWLRIAPRVLVKTPGRDDLRLDLGRTLLRAGQSVADLIDTDRHLELAAQWSEDYPLDGDVLRKATDIAEEAGTTGEHANWILAAAKKDGELLAELGRALAGGVVSLDTAIVSAKALIAQNAHAEAANILGRLPLSPEAGKAVKALKLPTTSEYAAVGLRCALACGDVKASRNAFDAAPGNVQALTREAGKFSASAMVLAELLIEQDKGEVAVPLLDQRREAGDEPRTLLPHVDVLLKASPQLGLARLLRGRLLHALGRERDAVRDLCGVGAGAGGTDAAFEMLGLMLEGEAAGAAAICRADILIRRDDGPGAVEELERSAAAPADRLARYDTVLEKEPKLDVAHRARGRALEALGQLADAATTQLARFDATPVAEGVDVDVEALARVALAGGDLPTVTRLLERLAAEAPDGASRGLGIVGNDERPTLLVLRAQLSLADGEPGAAVESLRKLVRDNADARKEAAEALERIVGSNQARPDADLALAEAYRAMNDGPAALGAVQRLYKDNVADSELVRDAALEIVRSHDAGDARLFLARISLDMKDPRGATEHAIHARQLRPDSRKQVVKLLVSALDQDAFAAATHFALAEAHLAGDEAEDGVRHFRAAVEVERSRAATAIQAMEESAPRSKNQSLLYLSIGSTHADFLRAHPDAITAFTSGLDAEPTAELRVSLLLARGDSHVAMGGVDEAFDDFDAASRLDRLERRYYEFLRINHRKREAAKAETSALLAEQDFSAAADACGRFIRVGRLDEAVSVAQRALSVNHDDARARYLVGVTLHAAERYDAAVQVLEAVREKAGADSEIGRAARMLLAESYLDRGDRTDARACLTEIESVDADYPGLRARRAALAPPADDPQAPPPLFVRPDFPRPTE